MSHSQSTTTVGQRAASVEFHGNVWNEQLILSLASRYSEAQYLKQAGKLAAEIKGILAGGAQEIKHSPYSDIIKCLDLVHALQSLGIHKYFTDEIKYTLDYVYRFWNDGKGVGFGSEDHAYPNLLSTSMAFRILRLNGYPVTPRAIGTFHTQRNFEFRAYTQPKSGQASTLTDEETYVRSILNLLCASQLSFPEEKTLTEAKHFSTQFLKNWLKQKESGTCDNNLTKEVKFVLEFPWHCSLPLWEPRHYIDIYQLNPDWISLSLNKKILKLARLDFNIKQAVYQQEMKEFIRWWRRDEVPKLSYMRLRPLESYFYAAMAIPDPKYSHARMNLANTTILAYVLDDTADNFATYSEHKRFCEAFDQGDLSMLETVSYPEEIKLVLKFATEWVAETAVAANRKLGPDLTPFLKTTLLDFIQAKVKELEWNEIKYIPSFEENLEVSVMSAGAHFICAYPLVFMDANFNLDKYTHIFNLGNTLTRLADDLIDFEDTNKPVNEVNVVESYLTYNPQRSREDASRYIIDRISHVLEEINLWYFHKDGLPEDCKTFCYNICKVIFFALHLVDGYTYTTSVIREQITKILLLPA